ncbi:MAG: MBL fold metallo-hydrolase, partial [Treponema sp.]|nr:MBL fold metallo-hydrolase [Candidatus Treponema equifaecale]
FTVTWFGHSSFLIQMNGKNILFHPVFSDMISPVSFTGVRKFTTAPVKIFELPEIDILILSHDHYDHLDYKSILELDPKVKQYVVPLGVENHLKKWKIAREKVKEMAWWEETEFEGLKISCTPARHFSGRWITGRNETLWCSWVLNDGKRQVFENGDSGYGSHYKQISQKFGGFDFALMECGQYNVRWPQIHSFPEEAVAAMNEIGAKLVMPVHWGAAILSDHGWDDSPERFVRAAEKENLTTITPFMGQTVNFNDEESLNSVTKNYWWREIE